MKKILSLLSLAALTIGLLGSCSKINERIDDLDKRVYDLENGKIASIEQQIAAINQSIADLETIRTNIQNLKNEQEAQGQDITALKAADITLEGKINGLKTYVNTELAKYATKDWANATFATLEQHQWTCDIIAKIDARIGALDANLSQSISGLESSLKQWVNEQLDAYYTAAQMDAKLDVMRNDINNAKVQGKIATDKADSLATELTALKTAVDTAKAAIRTEYRNAIDVAINNLDGEIRGALLDSIAAVNGRADALGTRVTTLEGKVLALEGNVSKLLAMIQSVTILPAYTDGSVEADDKGMLTIDFVVSPAAAVKGVTKDSIKVLVHEAKVQTKAATYTTIPVASADVNEATGDVTITADISKITPAEGKGLTVAVNIRNGGISNFTTEAVPVSVAGPALPEGALSGVFSVSATKKVYFSKGNLIATIDASGAPTAWKFSAHQYDCLGEGGANKTIGATAGDVDFFGWSTSTNGGTSTTDNYGIKTSTTNSDYSGDFYDWGKAVGDGNTWRTLSKDEWTYLFNTRTVNGGTGEGKSYQWAKIDVDPLTSVFGMILYPDNYTGTAETSYHINIWASLEAAGCVFLPAAGCRDGSLVGDVGAVGLYWSSTAHDEYSAYGVFFNSSNVYLDGYHARYVGFSVRLITESN